MDRTAIFVDAGYLFAQGSVAISDNKIARTNLVLDAPKAIEALRQVADQKAPKSSLLRIYWYDGANGYRPTTDQAIVANLDDVKLRLGVVNSFGQQKGVDSLIVTDLIELARLKSVSDAVLLSGDEDVRVGVQIAQNYGVRIHLLGIEPTRGSQSNQLMQEVDTKSSWDASVIRRFLSVREDASHEIEKAIESEPSNSKAGSEPTHDYRKIEIVVEKFVSALEQADLDGISAYWQTARGVPTELDKKILPICGSALGRKLERDEIRHMRGCFQKFVQQRVSKLHTR